MTIPPGLARTDVSVTLDYYTMGEATFIMREKAGKKLVKMSGKTIGTPRYLKSRSQGPGQQYPVYQLVAINGVIEIMEHRRLEPIVYITDDPAIREECLGKDSP
jgi:hypothetical protein